MADGGVRRKAPKDQRGKNFTSSNIMKACGPGIKNAPNLPSAFSKDRHFQLVETNIGGQLSTGSKSAGHDRWTKTFSSEVRKKKYGTRLRGSACFITIMTGKATKKESPPSKRCLAKTGKIELVVFGEKLKDPGELFEQAGFEFEYHYRPTGKPGRPNLFLLRYFFAQAGMKDPWGCPAMEAMASGCAVVTTDTGGSRDYEDR